MNCFWPRPTPAPRPVLANAVVSESSPHPWPRLSRRSNCRQIEHTPKGQRALSFSSMEGTRCMFQKQEAASAQSGSACAQMHNECVHRLYINTNQGSNTVNNHAIYMWLAAAARVPNHSGDSTHLPQLPLPPPPFLGPSLMACPLAADVNNAM